MERKTKGFLELQKYWYQKLSENGFYDIEVNETILKKEADRSKAYRKDDLNIQSKREYYLLLEQKLRENLSDFDDSYDQFIMVFIARGHKISEIIRMLERLNHRLTKKTVRIIRRKYENKWGIRTWNQEQMSFPKKKKA